MRVVVTRPEGRGQATATRLRQLGHEPILLPLSRAEHDFNATRNALSTSGDGLVVTSAEAARAIRASNADLGAWRDKPVFAVGEASAAAMSGLGFGHVIIGKGDGSDLAEKIATHHFAPKPARIVYLAGVPRAGGLEQQAAILHTNLETVEIYRMVPIVPDPGTLPTSPAGEGIDAVLFYSREAAISFFGLPMVVAHEDAWSRTRFVCLSPAIAQSLPQPFAARTIAAPEQTEESLLSCL